jgi:hypothetical protein
MNKDRDISDALRAYTKAWSTCCGNCGQVSELMKKCIYCSNIIYCTKECCEKDRKKHRKYCDELVLDRQMGRAPPAVDNGLYIEPEFMEDIIPYFLSFGISQGTAKILFTACSKCSILPVEEHVSELTSHPLGKLIGSRFYTDREKIKEALRKSYIRFDHPYFRYGSEVILGMCSYYDAHPDDLHRQASSFAPPANMDQWFSKEHI